jgi:hypothetical protein
MAVHSDGDKMTKDVHEMGLTIRFLKPCLCEGRCGDLVFHELFTPSDTVPDPGWPAGYVVSEIEEGPWCGDFRITHASVRGYVIEGIPAEAVKVLSGDGFPAPRRNPEGYAGWPRGLVLNDVPSGIVRSLDGDPTDFNGHLETLDRLWKTALETVRTR